MFAVSSEDRSPLPKVIQRAKAAKAMNAVTAPIPNPKSTNSKAHEPSMEEILASIRRIIADDQALPLTPRPAAANLRAVVAEPTSRTSPPEPPRRAVRPLPAADDAEFMAKLAASIANGKANAVEPAPFAVPASLRGRGSQS